MSHITVAASADAVRRMFEALRDRFTFSSSDSANFGPFSASYAVTLHLENGSVELRDDNTIAISQLDIKFDSLRVGIGFDIPELCIGGWCIIPNPFPIGPDCLLGVPGICLFSRNPDIDISLDLSGIVTVEVSATTRPVARYRVDPNRTAAMTYLDAEDASPPVPNQWQIFIDPVQVIVDVFNIPADIAANLLEQAVTNAINDQLPGPDWLKDLFRAILGPILDLVRRLLQLPDDIGAWLSDLLASSFGLLNLIVAAIAQYLSSEHPIHLFEDPLPILDRDANSIPGTTLIPVKIPIRDLGVRVNSREMI